MVFQYKKVIVCGVRRGDFFCCERNGEMAIGSVLPRREKASNIAESETANMVRGLLPA